MTTEIERLAAENLFRPAMAEKGSNSEKLQTLRARMKLQKSELRLREKQARAAGRPNRSGR